MIKVIVINRKIFVVFASWINLRFVRFLWNSVIWNSFLISNNFFSYWWNFLKRMQIFKFLWKFLIFRFHDTLRWIFFLEENPAWYKSNSIVRKHWPHTCPLSEMIEPRWIVMFKKDIEMEDSIIHHQFRIF